VGRYTDTCQRFRTVQKLVDADLNTAYLKCLHTYVMKQND